MKTLHFLWTMTAVCSFACPLAAEVSVASVFSDHMVLQRGRDVPVWGTAEPNADVTVALGSHSARGKADDQGRWMARFESLAASTSPQTLTITARDGKVEIHDVLVGDVWLCSGQSNMQMALHESAGGQAFAEQHGANPRIRLLSVPRTFSDKLQEKQGGRWTVSSSTAAAAFSAVGFTFGVFLAESPALADVPIGIVDSSFGATVVEAWIPAEDLAAFDPKDVGNSMFGKATQHYNAMIAPLLPLRLTGVIWYQGEGNAGRPTTYAPFLKTMIASWRKGFDTPELPFVIVQLPAFHDKFGDYFFTWLREQEAIVARDDPRVGLAVTYDTHDGSDLHPPEKIPVGQRSALVARGLVYGEKVASPPTFAAAKPVGNSLRVRFDTSGDALTTSDGSSVVRGFMVAGSDGDYRYATGAIEGNDTVALTAEGVAEPRTVRFAWAGAPDANLVNRKGLPAAPFRTDGLPTSDIELVEVPVSRTLRTGDYEVVLDANGGLVSLGVHDRQFISNDMGLRGGTKIPTWLGSHNLNKVRQLGPNRIACSNSELTMTFAFGESSIELTLDNRSKQEVTFQMALAQGVEAATAKGSPIVLMRQGVGLTLEGFDRVEKQQDGSLFVKTAVPAGESRTMKLDVP